MEALKGTQPKYFLSHFYDFRLQVESKINCQDDNFSHKRPKCTKTLNVLKRAKGVFFQASLNFHMLKKKI